MSSWNWLNNPAPSPHTILLLKQNEHSLHMLIRKYLQDTALSEKKARCRTEHCQIPLVYFKIYAYIHIYALQVLGRIPKKTIKSSYIEKGRLEENGEALYFHLLFLSELFAFVLPYTCVTFVIKELILKGKCEYCVANGKCVWYYLKWPKRKDKAECVLCRQHRCVQRVFGDKGNPAASGLHSCPCPSSPGSPSSPQTSTSSLSTNTQSGVSSLRQTKNSTTPLAPRLSYSFHSPSELASIPPLSG